MAQHNHIPPAPELPLGWNPNTRDVGYRFDEATRTFKDGRTMNTNDPHGRWTYADYTDPIRLGAPSAGPNWHPIIHKWGLQALDAAGFINSKADTGVEYPPGRMASLHSDDPIHPAFRRDMWRGVTDKQWSCIQPAVQLASSILDEPDTLRFFAGCVNRTLPQKLDPHVGPYYKFDIPTSISDHEAKVMWDATVGMRKYVYYEIKDFDYWMTYPISGTWEQCYGVTQPDYDQNFNLVPGHLPDDPTRGGKTSWSSTVWFPDTWLKPGERILSHPSTHGGLHRMWLEECQGLASAEANRRIAIHPKPAILRTVYQFATVILHEFTHAFVNAYHPKHVSFPMEPFCGNDMVCEVGWAFQQHVFGAAVMSQGYVIPPLSLQEELDQAPAAPFGLYADEHWDRFRAEGNVLKTLGGTVDYSLSHDSFPVHQSDTDKIFTKDFWEQQVARFGARELTVKKNAWFMQWKDDPAFKGLSTETWGEFDRRTNQLGWNVGIAPGVFSIP